MHLKEKKAEVTTTTKIGAINIIKSKVDVKNITHDKIQMTTYITKIISWSFIYFPALTFIIKVSTVGIKLPNMEIKIKTLSNGLGILSNVALVIKNNIIDEININAGKINDLTIELSIFFIQFPFFITTLYTEHKYLMNILIL